MSSVGSREEARAARHAAKRTARKPTEPYNTKMHPLLAQKRMTARILGPPAKRQKIPIHDPSEDEDEPDHSKANRRLAKWKASIQELFEVPETVLGSVGMYSTTWFRQISFIRKEVKERIKECDPDAQQKFAFTVSSLLGTLLFFLLFKIFHAVFLARRFFDPPLSQSRAFAFAYCISYLLSVVWQHVLNRTFVFPENNEDSFFDSLLSTYLVYGISLLLASLLSIILITIIQINPGLVFWLTLPLNGVSNFYLLRRCFNSPNHVAKQSVITVL